MYILKGVFKNIMYMYTCWKCFFKAHHGVGFRLPSDPFDKLIRRELTGARGQK